MDAALIRRALLDGVPVSDLEFDLVYPEKLRRLSLTHWTPVAVAVRAARWLTPRSDVPTRILDVGAGVGKACLIGSLVTSAEWYGVERDPIHVKAAFTAARKLRVNDRAWFAQGDASLISWDDYDGLYFYNPLGSLLSNSMGLDPRVRRPTYASMLDRVEQRLARARVGTRVVTFHGFGGAMPDGYELVESDKLSDGVLELWIRSGGKPS